MILNLPDNIELVALLSLGYKDNKEYYTENNLQYEEE